MGKYGGYLEARRATEDKGGLPSNVLHDDCLGRRKECRRKTDDWRHLKGLYPAWTKEILVYPEKGGRFDGSDVVDSETGWILPGEYVPEEAIGRKRVGLFVDPADIKEEKGKIIVHANSVLVLHPFIQRSGKGGKVHEETRIPLEVESEIWKALSSKERRWLRRINGAGVRPLHRDYGDVDWRHVDTTFRPDGIFGVAYVNLEEATPERLAASRRLLQALV